MSARFHSTAKKGFTLVEILIVVVILGILAAIVIPQFTSDSESARASSLVSQLQTIRSQLEFYQIQHNGNYPALTDGETEWALMTGKTNATSTEVVADGDFGPYLQQAPKNPFVASDIATKIKVVTGTTTALTGDSATEGWVYNSSTGQIKAVLPDTVVLADLGLSTNDVVGGDDGTE